MSYAGDEAIIGKSIGNVRKCARPKALGQGSDAPQRVRWCDPFPRDELPFQPGLFGLRSDDVSFLHSSQTTLRMLACTKLSYCEDKQFPEIWDREVDSPRGQKRCTAREYASVPVYVHCRHQLLTFALPCFSMDVSFIPRLFLPFCRPHSYEITCARKFLCPLLPHLPHPQLPAAPPSPPPRLHVQRRAATCLRHRPHHMT